MEKQNTIPPVLRSKVLFTCMTGIGIGTVAAIVFAVSKDHTILTLGCILCIWCLFRGWVMRHNIRAAQYESVIGQCTAVIHPAFHRYTMVYLTLDDGSESILLLNNQKKIKPDTWYRFYFQLNSSPRLGNDYLDAALSTNGLLGYEEIPPK